MQVKAIIHGYNGSHDHDPVKPNNKAKLRMFLGTCAFLGRVAVVFLAADHNCSVTNLRARKTVRREVMTFQSFAKLRSGVEFRTPDVYLLLKDRDLA